MGEEVGGVKEVAGIGKWGDVVGGEEVHVNCWCVMVKKMGKKEWRREGFWEEVKMKFGTVVTTSWFGK